MCQTQTQDPKDRMSELWEKMHVTLDRGNARIQDIDLVEGERCPHMRNGWHPCGIYDDRPAGCRKFECDWLRGHLASKDRPDKFGLVVTAQEGGLVCFEVWPDAHKKNDRARAFITRAAEVARVIVVRPGGTRTVIDNRRRTP